MIRNPASAGAQAVLRRSLRGLREPPLYAPTVIILLALGIGAATAGFSIADRLMWQPIPGVPSGRSLIGFTFADRAEGRDLVLRPVSTGEHAELLRGLPSGFSFAGYLHYSARMAIAGRERVGRLAFVTPNYFQVLHVAPAAGRPLEREDQRSAGATSSAIVSHDVAVSLHGTGAAALGRSVRLNGREFTIIGVAPPNFKGLTRSADVDVWLPGSAMASEAFAADPPAGGYFQFVARIPAGSRPEQLEAHISAVSRRVLDRVPVFARDLGLPPALRVSVREAAWLVLAVGGAVLAVAWANLANVLVLRVATRRPTLALKRLLGAGTWHLLREPLVEVGLLAVAGTLLGVLVAATFARLFASTTILPQEAGLAGLSLSPRAVAAAAAASLATAVSLTAMLAALSARVRPAEVAQVASTTHTARTRLRVTLAAIQLGVSLALLTGTVLLLRTLGNFQRVDLGFDPTAVMVFRSLPMEPGLTEARQRAYLEEALHRVNGVSVVERAALATSVPFGGAWSMLRVRLPGTGRALLANSNAVSPDYFRSLRIPLLAGRDFSPDEALHTQPGSQGVVIVTEGLAALLANGHGAVGSYLDLGQQGRYRVVGVVPRTRWRSLGDVEGPSSTTEFVYRPLGQGPIANASVMVVVRLVSPKLARTALPEIVEAMRAPGAGVGLGEGASLSRMVADYLTGRRAMLRLLVVLTVITLLLSTIGLYGLLGYEVSARTHELAVRTALGASSWDISKVVAGTAIGILGLGVTAGIMGGWAVGRALRNQLYGVTPLDPLSYLVAVGALVAAATLACAGPARRAVAAHPMDSLRRE